MKKESKDNIPLGNVRKGEVYWFDPLKETKVGTSPLAVVLSGEMHNKFSSYVIFNLASTKGTETLREFFEVLCEVEGKKIRVITSAIHIFNKEVFLKEAKHLGNLSQAKIKEINERVKLILELD